MFLKEINYIKDIPSIEEIQSNSDFNIEYLIAVVHNKEILHICGYENYPNINNLEHFISELKTDKEFGYSVDIIDESKLKILSKEEYTRVFN